MHRRSQEENRKRFFQKIGIDHRRIVAAGLVHAAAVAKVSEDAAGTFVSEIDGLVTNTPNLFLSATSADCFILYFYDPAKKAVGIAHGGWRGILAGIVEHTIHTLKTNFDTSTANLLVGMAPGIRGCHFEISYKDKDLFRRFPQHVSEKNGKVFVNLPGIIVEQLQRVGVLRAHIEDSGVCTHCQEEKYFSYRRDKPKEPHVMIGYIGMKNRENL